MSETMSETITTDIHLKCGAILTVVSYADGSVEFYTESEHFEPTVEKIAQDEGLVELFKQGILDKDEINAITEAMTINHNSKIN